MIACDIALVPPAETMKRIVKFNREIMEGGMGEIVLDTEKCLPHITLAMGCIKNEDLPEINKVLHEIADSCEPITLNANFYEQYKTFIGFERTSDICDLHEIVMVRLARYFSYNVSEDMFYREEKEQINGITFDYVKTFASTSAFENYLPHITVGFGEAEIDFTPFDFTADTIALCQLGNYCTCRKVLSSYKLEGTIG